MYCLVLLVAAYFIKASEKKPKKTTQPKLPQETPQVSNETFKLCTSQSCQNGVNFLKLIYIK